MSASSTKKSEPEPKIDQTRRDVADSLTGYEERAIAARFSQSLEEMSSLSQLSRALIFVVEKRKLPNAPESEKTAFKLAMDMSRGEADAYFVPLPDGDESGDDESGEA